jgi:hypothetical protein
MVVAVNLFELDGKIGANPYVAVGVDTHAGLASPPAVKACKPVKPRSYWVCPVCQRLDRRQTA